MTPALGHNGGPPLDDPRILFSAATLAPIPLQSAPVRFDLLAQYPLRDYQLRVLLEAASLMRMGYRRVLIQMPTGAGKTVLAAALLGGASVLDYSSQFIVHRKELITQTSKSFDRFGIEHGFVASGRPFDPDPLLHLAGVATLVNRLGDLLPPDLQVVDECFIAGTQIDSRNIETLNVGDLVTAFDENTGDFNLKTITNIFKNSYRGPIVQISTVGGVTIFCTANHPIYTKRGWLNAGEIGVFDEVLRNQSDLQHLRGTVGYESEAPSGHAEKHRSIILQPGVCESISRQNIVSDHGSNESPLCFCADENQQSDEARRDSRAYARYVTQDRAQTGDPGWQRATCDEGRTAPVGPVRARGFQPAMHCSRRIRHGERLADTLQNRLWQLGSENSDRSGRSVAQYTFSQGPGPSQRRLPHWERVDRIQIHQSDDLRADRNSSFDGYVYNLEVEDLHTYTANGLVVHNCHHSTAATWNRVMGDGFILGLTATPERLDGRGLDDHFDVMVKGPSPAWLIQHGYLSPFDYYAPHIPDTSGIDTVAGDFHKGQGAALMDQPALIGNIVEHYLELAAGQKGLVFASTREHSRKLAEAFTAEGVPAEHVEGTMKGDKRERAFDAFDAGDTRLLINVDICGEGLDVAGVNYVGLGRITKSRSLHKQQCGRAIRPPDRAIICDHAGNGLRLQDLPDTDVDWTLQGRVKSTRNSATLDPGQSIRQCLECYRIAYSFEEVCPGCGTEFPKRAARSMEQVEGKLSKVDQEEMRAAAARQRKSEEKQCKSYRDFLNLATARGYSNPDGWAKMRMKFKTSYRGSGR